VASDLSEIDAAIRDLASALQAAGAEYMIFGGVAVIARGVPRHTDDVDATVWGEGVALDSLVKLLASQGIEPRIPEALAFARENQVLLLRHGASGIDIEVTFGWLPFEREALDRADTLSLAGVSVPVATPEDLVIYKAVAWRDRDRTDVERLLTLYGDRIDLGRVRRVVGEFAEALETPERLAELDAMIARTMKKPPGRRT
jgi:predicted nucleotidyltransferase